MRRLAFILLAVLSLSSAPLSDAASWHADPNIREESFSEPIDGLSVELPDRSVTLEVSGFTGTAWTAWRAMAVDDEDDPLSRETNLVIFPEEVSRIRIRGRDRDIRIRPVRIASEPARVLVAGLNVAQGLPRILSRAEWGADETLGTMDPAASSSSVDTEAREAGNGNTSTTVSKRLQDCQEAQRLYGTEFKTLRTETTDGNGSRLLWPRQYAPAVRLVVVHHTAMETANDNRSGVERMRALYQYHSSNRGWGDIGYHYVIDETGQIYEGRSGGDGVVGGHVYCNNIGTVGIALMGNFEVEEPTQAQVKSLQWLSDALVRKFGIDMGRDVAFHGKVVPPIVGHRDLTSTLCPGHFMAGALDQVRRNVQSGNLDAGVRFPAPRSSSSSRSSAPAPPARNLPPEGLSALGDTVITGRPGSEVTVALRYRAGAKAVRKGKSLGQLTRSSPRLLVWTAQGDTFVRTRANLSSPFPIKPGETVTIRVKVQIPRERGTHVLRIGPLSYTINVEGKRLPSASREPTYQMYVPPPSSSSVPIARSSSSHSTLPTSSRSSESSATSASSVIRIRLTAQQDPEAKILLTAPAIVNGSTVNPGTVTLRREGGQCTAEMNGTEITRGIVRIDPQGGISTVTSMQKARNRYRGIIECLVWNDALVLINELLLEQYLAGLAEEPDTEPPEKQKAFAVAARTYAAYYMDTAHRKFPGAPYHGSDSPAEFQAYGGAAFEEGNPAWVKAVTETRGETLTKGGQIIRAPYFSSDDGRTRAPEEAGWKSFPFPEVFVSKPDPWCNGMPLRGHGVGMSGCGAKGQAYEGKTYLEILGYYYPGTRIEKWKIENGTLWQ